MLKILDVIYRIIIIILYALFIITFSIYLTVLLDINENSKKIIDDLSIQERLTYKK